MTTILLSRTPHDPLRAGALALCLILASSLSGLPAQAQDSPAAGGLGAIFDSPPVPAFRFPARGQDLDDGVYWQVFGHSSGHARDMNAVRFDEDSQKWTRNRPNSENLGPRERRLIWGMPVRAMADGVVLTCWRNAPDGPDPGRDGCDGVCEDFDECSCTTPAGGNHVHILTSDNRTLLHAHLQEGSVPDGICPHDDIGVADWNDKSGPFGFNPDIVVPENQRATVQAGDLLGLVGDSGRSGGPHLHIHMRQCDASLEVENCSVQPLVLTGARVMERPPDGVIEDDDWSRLNGVIPVTSPVQIVLPDGTIGGLQPVPIQNVSIDQLTQDAFAQVLVDAVNPADPVRAWEWERVDPSLNAIGNAARIQWSISANCPSGVQQISMTSPGGQEAQSFGGDATVDGQFATQSFSAHGLEQICLDWAAGVSSSHLCNQAPEDCPDEETFQLTGGITPPLVDDTVEVTVQCGNGSTTTTTGQPQLALRCGAVAFGFPH